VCLWLAAWYALGFHCLPARHGTQPQKGFGPRSNGTNPGLEGGTEGPGLPSNSEPLHLTFRGEGLTLVLTPKETQTLFLDRQGLGGFRQAEGDARARSNPDTIVDGEFPPT
jgi:hypothetical protein